eukprot:TRINITY_DN1693_c0_g1_i1.p1 TRINITY_DN1693_c0_g1~~TRINITY_DN1693_c0_g1_i1.p1  ORF type:complete len:501 (+),score=36.14 TRINITY_DN1693_c0_g1_i1:54-1505(+)
MKQFVLFFDPSSWNVLKFVAISIIITPLLENLLNSLIISRATLSVRRGVKLQIFDSRLGIFALHSRYAGSRFSRFWLLLCAAFILLVELLLEFSFSSTQIHSSAVMDVWLGPTHSDRYLASPNTTFVDEPTRLIDEIYRNCIEGPTIMNRSEASNEEYSVVARYSLSAEYIMHKPYIQRGGTGLVCDSESTTQTASFVTENVVGSLGYEGFHSNYGPQLKQNSSWNQIIQNENFTVHGLFKFDNMVDSELMYIYMAEHTVCVGNNGKSHFLCAISNASAIAISVSPSLDYGHSIALFASGQAILCLHEKSRKIRLMAYLTEKRILDRSNPYSYKEIFQMVPKFQLEQVAMAALAVASEEGVTGLEYAKAERNIVLRQTRQVSTMSAFGFLPLTILAVVALSIMCWDAIVRVKIWKWDGKRGGVLSALFPKKRVEMSMQWLRETIREDLIRSGLGDSTATESVRVRVVCTEGTARLRVLPDRNY